MSITLSDNLAETACKGSPPLDEQRSKMKRILGVAVALAQQSDSDSNSIKANVDRWRSTIAEFAKALNGRTPVRKDLDHADWPASVAGKRKRWSFLAGVRKAVRNLQPPSVFESAHKVESNGKPAGKAAGKDHQAKSPAVGGRDDVKAEVKRIVAELRRYRAERKQARAKAADDAKNAQSKSKLKGSPRIGDKRDSPKTSALTAGDDAACVGCDAADRHEKVHVPLVRSRRYGSASQASTPPATVPVGPITAPPTGEVSKGDTSCGTTSSSKHKTAGSKKRLDKTTTEEKKKKKKEKKEKKDERKNEGPSVETVLSTEAFVVGGETKRAFRNLGQMLQQMRSHKVPLQSRRRFLQFEIKEYRTYSKDPRSGMVPFPANWTPAQSRQLIKSMVRFEHKRLGHEASGFGAAPSAHASVNDLFLKGIFQTSTFWLKLESRLHSLSVLVLDDLIREQEEEDVDLPRELTAAALAPHLKEWPDWLQAQLLSQVNEKVALYSQALMEARDMQAEGQPSETVDAYFETAYREISTFGGLTAQECSDMQETLAAEYHEKAQAKPRSAPKQPSNGSADAADAGDAAPADPPPPSADERKPRPLPKPTEENQPDNGSLAAATQPSVSDESRPLKRQCLAVDVIRPVVASA